MVLSHAARFPQLYSTRDVAVRAARFRAVLSRPADFTSDPPGVLATLAALGGGDGCGGVRVISVLTGEYWRRDVLRAARAHGFVCMHSNGTIHGTVPGLLL